MRGASSKIGSTRIAANGYHYTKTHEGWRLTHHIIAERLYGRKVDKEVTVRFKDTDRTNLADDNIVLTPKRGKGRADLIRTRIRQYEERIRELKAELNSID